MIRLMMSIFDKIYGPKVFLKVPNSNLKDYPVDHIPILMDIYDKGFFIHEFGELKTANYIFTIYSPQARGERELIMISIISVQEDFYNIDLSSFKEILQYFALELGNIPNMYKGMYPSETAEGADSFDEITDLLDLLYNSIIERFSHHFKEKITYELSNLGKKSIINDLKAKFIQSKNIVRKPVLTNPVGTL